MSTTATTASTATTPPATLHIIYDPLCGWCYAVSPLLEALLQAHPGLRVQLHAGGLFTEQRITEGLEEHIREHDARIHRLSGQIFSDAYLFGLLNDPDTLFDSPTVIAAVLAMEALDPRAGVPMARAIQTAHYQSGLKVVKREVLCELATHLGQSATAFLDAYARHCGAPTREHIAATRRFMHDHGIPGYPAFILQQGEHMTRLDHQSCYRQPQDFVDNATKLLQTTA